MATTIILVYRPVTFACLAVLQFLMVLGKKKYVNLKTTCGVITLCIGVIFIFVTPTVQVVHDSSERLICDDNFCPSSRPQTTGSVSVVVKVLIAITVGSLFPSLLIVPVLSTWSYAVFRNYYTGGDDQLNRRMLSLPVVMPLAASASSTLELVLIMTIGRVLLMFPLIDYYPYWALFTKTELYIIFRIVARIIYPLVLIYTHSHVRQAVKKLLTPLIMKCSNRVTPEASNS